MHPKTWIFVLLGVCCCLLFFFHDSEMTELWLARTPRPAFTAFNIQFRKSRAKLSPQLQNVFDTFFQNVQVNWFKNEYSRRCSVSSSTGTLVAVLNGKTSGFGSVLNNAMNIILIAWEPSVNRHFTLLETPTLWSYAPLSEFFDHPVDSPCSLVRVSPNVELLREKETFDLAMSSGTRQVRFSGKLHQTIRYFGERWSQYRNVTEEILIRDGTEKVFRRKSALTRALWNFRPDYKALLKELWSKVLDKNGRYFAVHIRRGDKLAAKEMENVPIEKYWEKVASICKLLKNSCPHNVFVMYDEPEELKSLKELAVQDASTRFFDFPMLINSTGRDLEDFVSLSPPALFVKNDKNEWFKHTQEMLLSMTLLAMSDQLICTFSSNVCRLAALIRGDLNPETIHGLDAPTWHNL
ncbi:hypothetical protein RvY_01379 [Ramazzottius varieornatus]|uniref:Peptide-O-fucosyltransferase n=1 Tax=Ramazzottius varieornatus TaxID=947166 RepID=A0A1D1UH21_RAMVA|nr:hypothetical protein RvY_01379 [Ramazzottius varieornatus]